MLTFKPAAGSYVAYDPMRNGRRCDVFLITSYMEERPDIANILILSTMQETCIIVQFREHEFNRLLTVVA